MISLLTLIHIILVAAATSFSISMLVVLTQRWHGRLSMDSDLTGVQKFHKNPVPRVGGIGLFLGILIVLLFEVLNDSAQRPYHADTLSRLVLAGVPAFAAGLVEDLTKKVSVKARLLATITSALLACLLLDAHLPRLDIWGLDDLLRLLPFAIVITAIAVAGVANSINIIDGFNGLAGTTSIIILAGMSAVAWQVEDPLVLKLAMAGIGATLGFLLLNYPTGKLFMGDGGAYFLGFWIAETAVLLVMRNPGIVTWQVLAICAYPIIEVLYSIYRRTIIRHSSASAPDRLHLHTLIYRRVACQRIARSVRDPWIRNAVVAGLIAIGTAAMTTLAVSVGHTLTGALIVLGIEVLTYMAVYTRLVRGKWNMSAPHRRRFGMFHRGDRVAITTGPFAGWQGTYQFPAGRARAMVLIELMRQPQNVRFEMGMLSKVA